MPQSPQRMWIGNWLTTGFVDRLFSLLLDKEYHIYLTADHGNVESTGVGRPRKSPAQSASWQPLSCSSSPPTACDSGRPRR